MHRRALAGCVVPPGKDAQRRRHPGRPPGRRADRSLPLARRLGDRLDRAQLAEPALARPHRHRRVALRELDRIEPLVHRTFQVLRGHVLAQADEAAAAVAGPRADAAHALARRRAGDLHAFGQRRRHEDPAPRVVGDGAAGLRDERVGGLPAGGGDEQVAGDRAAVEHDAGESGAARFRGEPRQRSRREVDLGRDRDPVGAQQLRDRAGARRDDDSGLTRC